MFYSGHSFICFSGGYIIRRKVFCQATFCFFLSWILFRLVDKVFGFILYRLDSRRWPTARGFRLTKMQSSSEISAMIQKNIVGIRLVRQDYGRANPPVNASLFIPHVARVLGIMVADRVVYRRYKIVIKLVWVISLKRRRT